MPIELPNISGEWIDKIFRLKPASFEAMALETFVYQYHHNTIYAQYANAVGKSPANVKALQDIPFLPIRFFKSHQVTSGDFVPEAVFESSGTTQTINSKHYVKSLAIYRESFLRAFEHFYGDIKDWCIIGLLPSYLERSNSSLVVMADELIKRSNHSESGFYLYEHEKLTNALQQLEAKKQKTLLLGVTFALLDFADDYPQKLQHTIVMETGGMKGRREEWTRQQVHDFLTAQLGVPVIHSEYGMTELLSQAYSDGNGIFRCPDWMKIVLRADDDPLQLSESNTGIINVIDLANIYSCSFIATDDAGKLYKDGSFEVIGRTDNSDLRGCSLMTL
ncbi:MAG: acyl transferase [Chitinophagaceae bacterium]